MDFFRAQHNARHRTRLLVGLFLLSLICLLTMANLILYFAFGDESDLFFYVAISAVILLIVLFSSLLKTISLRQGGEAVAQMLNARLLSVPSTRAEQRLLNVVEEMAIASGTPVPPVYVMEEVAINAFAAGHSINDAVIGVTRGTIENLNRDELQGVIAHEFSHILHGDMRLNLRLISWLHGIMVLSIMGHYILRAAPATRRNNNNNAGIALFGLGLIVLGASGSFFGGLIKAAVSRQREYLADASAVQYTRNPQGIAGALKRIAVDTNSQVLTNSATSQISHALFSEGVHLSFSSLFATHPALDKRIRDIDPNWDGEYQPNTSENQTSSSAALLDQNAKQTHKISAPLAIALAIARAGAPDDLDVSDAQSIHRSLPTRCAELAHNPLGAASVIALLLMQQELSQLYSARAAAQQLQDMISMRLPADVGSELRAEIIRILPDVLTINDGHRLPLANICLGTLRQLSLAQYQGYSLVLQHILDSDTSPDLSSWVLFQLTTHHLDKAKGLISPTLLSARTTLAQSVKSLEIFFSLLSQCGHPSAEQTESAFNAATNDIRMPNLTFIPLTDLGLLEFQQATVRLTTLVDADKQRLLNAMSVCIYHDGKLTVAENELMKMTSELLDWPLPANIFRSN